MGLEIQPHRLALRYVPAALIVEYTLGFNKASFYHHEIDLNSSFTSNKQEIEEIMKEMIEKHQEVLEKISKQQLQRLLQHLADHYHHHHHHHQKNLLLPVLLPQADYNRVSESQLKQVKSRMDVVFQQNLLKPGDEGYVYDKQVDFKSPQEKSEWDDNDDDFN